MEKFIFLDLETHPELQTAEIWGDCTLLGEWHKWAFETARVSDVSCAGGRLS